MRILLVGDPHVTVEELDDCRALEKSVLDVVGSERPDAVVFLGDQHHNHSVVRVEVIEFWRRFFSALRNLGVKTYALVGNHDRPGDSSSTATAMMAYEDLVEVVDGIHHLCPGVYMMAYYHDPKKFVEDANGTGATTLICHQTFAGSLYENGFYAEDGVNPDFIDAKKIISGHIHSPQEFGRVWYPGAPRWRTRSDVNTDRHIYVVEFDGHGNHATSKRFSTRGSCRQLVAIQDVEGEAPVYEGAGPVDVLEEITSPFILYVDIKGTQAYVDKQLEYWKARGARCRTLVTAASAPKVKESEGISTALNKFLTGYSARHGTPADVLIQMARERLHV